MLVTMTARLVRSHGRNEIPLPGAGRIEYAASSYQPTPRPGADPSKVTDAHILHALGTIKEEPS